MSSLKPIKRSTGLSEGPHAQLEAAVTTLGTTNDRKAAKAAAKTINKYKDQLSEVAPRELFIAQGALAIRRPIWSQSTKPDGTFAKCADALTNAIEKDIKASLDGIGTSDKRLHFRMLVAQGGDDGDMAVRIALTMFAQGEKDDQGAYWLAAYYGYLASRTALETARNARPEDKVKLEATAANGEAVGFRCNKKLNVDTVAREAFYQEVSLRESNLLEALKQGNVALAEKLAGEQSLAIRQWTADHTPSLI